MFRREASTFTSKPAVEKTRSAGTEVAGIARYCLARTLSFLYRPWLVFHHSSGLAWGGMHGSLKYSATFTLLDIVISSPLQSVLSVAVAMWVQECVGCSSEASGWALSVWLLTLWHISVSLSLISRWRGCCTQFRCLCVGSSAVAMSAALPVWDQ